MIQKLRKKLTIKLCTLLSVVMFFNNSANAMAGAAPVAERAPGTVNVLAGGMDANAFVERMIAALPDAARDALPDAVRDALPEAVMAVLPVAEVAEAVRYPVSAFIGRLVVAGIWVFDGLGYVQKAEELAQKAQKDPVDFFLCDVVAGMGTDVSKLWMLSSIDFIHNNMFRNAFEIARSYQKLKSKVLYIPCLGYRAFKNRDELFEKLNKAMEKIQVMLIAQFENTDEPTSAAIIDLQAILRTVYARFLKLN